MTALSALAAATIAPPQQGDIPPELEALVLEACAGAWHAVEVVFAGDVLRGRLGKTRDTIVREAVEGVLAMFGVSATSTSIRADALAGLRAARDAGALDGDGAFDIAAVVADVREHGAVAVGRAAITEIRRSLADHRDLEAALGDHEIASLLIDTARACLRHTAREPHLAAWAIGPTGSPGRDRALAAFAELAASPDSLAELEALIALPIHLDENVQFTVYRPRAIDPGKWHQLLAFAHLAERRPGEQDLPDPVEEVQRQAAQVLGQKAQHYQSVVQDSGSAIPEEGELTFVPEFSGIEVNPPRRSFLWLEPVHREEFRIRAPRGLEGKTVRGRLTVFLGHIAIAEVALSVRVDSARPEPRVREPSTARAYRKIFASYSHRDADIVNQFETYARALGDEYLRDWVHLRTGEVWTDRLCQLIDQADAFQLFWSHNSMHSQFVRQEYEYALSLGRPSFVRPTYWEEPMPTAPGLPPESLLRLHFQKLGAEMIAVGAGSRKKKESVDAMIVERERAESNAATAVYAAEPEPADSFSDTRHDVHAIAPEPDDVTDPGVVLPPPANTCTACGTVNTATAVFCQTCGNPMGASAELVKRRKSAEPAPATPLRSRTASPSHKEAAASPPRRDTVPRMRDVRSTVPTPTAPMQVAPPAESDSDTATDTPRAPSAPVDHDFVHDDMEREQAPSRPAARDEIAREQERSSAVSRPAPARPGGRMPSPAAPAPEAPGARRSASPAAPEAAGTRHSPSTAPPSGTMPAPYVPAPAPPGPMHPAETKSPAYVSAPPRPMSAPSAPAPGPSSPSSPPGMMPPPSAPAPGPSSPPGMMPPPSAPAPGPSSPSSPPGMPPSARPSSPSRPLPSILPSPASRPSQPPMSQPRPGPPSPPMSQPRPVLMASQPRPAPVVEERESQKQVASASPSPDSWTDEARPPVEKPRPSTPAMKSVMADPSAPKLFPSESKLEEQAIPEAQSITTTQPMSPPPPGGGRRTPSQAPPTSPIPSTLPGVRADIVPGRPSMEAAPPGDDELPGAPPMPPVGGATRKVGAGALPPMTDLPSLPGAPAPMSSPAEPQPIVAPSPWAKPDEAADATAPAMAAAAPSPAPPPFKTMMSSDGVSAFGPTMPVAALQEAPDDFKQEAPKSSLAGSANDVQMMKKLPNAPASHGWVLAVVITLIVVAAIVLIVLLT